MTITISRDDSTYGPYTLQQVKTYLGSGDLDLDDQACVNGSNKWVSLRHIVAPDTEESPATSPDSAPPPRSNFVPRSNVAAPANGPSSSFVTSNISSSMNLLPGEEVFWCGNPSQILNLPKWGLRLIFIVICLGIWFSFCKQYVNMSDLFAYPNTLGEFGGQINQLLYAFPLLLAGLLGLDIMYIFQLTLATTYTVTTQRLRVQSGIITSTVDEVELFRVRDLIAQRPLILQPFNLGSLIILSGDELNPVLRLNAIPNVAELREQIRGQVLALRQKYGVRQLEVSG